MRKLIFLLFYTSLFKIQAQNLDIRGNLYVRANLGIGTYSPSEKLEIRGNQHLYGILRFNEDGNIANTHINTYEFNLRNCFWKKIIVNYNRKTKHF